MAERKYEKYFAHGSDLPISRTPDRDGKIFHDIVMGNEVIKECPFWVYTGLICKAGAGYSCGDEMFEWHSNGEAFSFQTKPHKHHYPEGFIFIGTDPEKPRDLCGEVEYWMGEGEEAEKYTITESTFIYVPPNTVHCPIWVKRVDRPFVMTVYLADTTPSPETGPHPFPPDFTVPKEYLNRKYKGTWPKEFEEAVKKS